MVTLQLVTAPVAILLALWALASRPSVAIGVLFASCLLWPELYRFPLGPIQMSAPRIVALALLAKSFTTRGSPPFRWSILDVTVIALFLWTVLANVAERAPKEMITQQIGLGLDTVLVYFAVRAQALREGSFAGALRLLAPLCIVVAGFAMVEAVQGFSPLYDVLPKIGLPAPPRTTGGADMRLGMNRAGYLTGQPIYFGLFMAMLAGLYIAGARSASRTTAWLGGLACAAAVFFSLSSGPWTMLFLTLALCCFNGVRWAVWPTVIGAVCLMILAELFSNRHFYHLIDYLALNSGNAWYRSRLIEVAWAHIGEYWLFGYGGRDISHWGAQIDGRTIVDLVNNYIIVMYRGGALALVLHLFIKVRVLAATSSLARSGARQVRWAGFMLGAVTVALAITEMSVGLFSTPLIMSYSLYGLIAGMNARPRIAAPRRPAPRRPTRSPHDGRARFLQLR